MGMFVRVTLTIAAVIVAFAALILLLKLLVVAAVVAVAVLAIGFIIRFIGCRCGFRGNLPFGATTFSGRR